MCWGAPSGVGVVRVSSKLCVCVCVYIHVHTCVVHIHAHVCTCREERISTGIIFIVFPHHSNMYLCGVSTACATNATAPEKVPCLLGRTVSG